MRSLIVVVFPAPLCPRKPKTSPSSISKSRWSRAMTDRRLSPIRYSFVKPFIRSGFILAVDALSLSASPLLSYCSPPEYRDHTDTALRTGHGGARSELLARPSLPVDGADLKNGLGIARLPLQAPGYHALRSLALIAVPKLSAPRHLRYSHTAKPTTRPHSVAPSPKHTTELPDLGDTPALQEDELPWQYIRLLSHHLQVRSNN